MTQADTPTLKLLITGGGTGGHIYPALAVGRFFLQLSPHHAVLYMGHKTGLEKSIIQEEGLPFYGLMFSGMPRKKSLMLPFEMIQWLASLHQAKKTALALLQDLKPDMVFGTGGYITAPILMAAHQLKIPYAIHEPDACPGLVNRYMGKHATLITTSFKEGEKALRHSPSQQVLVTGNPLRGQVGQLTPDYARKQLGIEWTEDMMVLLVTGGSQGARSLNDALVDALPQLLQHQNLAVIHITGEKRYPETLDKIKGQCPDVLNNPRYYLKNYTSLMPAILEIAKLAVCRAGALTLSEMYLCGIPTILIPYPYAAANHQHINSEASVRAGASVMIADSALTGERLLKEVEGLLNQPQRYTAMANAALKQATPNATQDIVNGLLHMVNAV
jgi:UDP-N-acetylglucosamine--N-acetylmuramyl-(pentapeptide) pyrophosphoryl-undecaprenol N-acetylglucosamine transferase